MTHQIIQIQLNNSGSIQRVANRTTHSIEGGGGEGEELDCPNKSIKWRKIKDRVLINTGNWRISDGRGGVKGLPGINKEGSMKNLLSRLKCDILIIRPLGLWVNRKRVNLGNFFNLETFEIEINQSPRKGEVDQVFLLNCFLSSLPPSPK